MLYLFKSGKIALKIEKYALKHSKIAPKPEKILINPENHHSLKITVFPAQTPKFHHHKPQNPRIHNTSLIYGYIQSLHFVS